MAAVSCQSMVQKCLDDCTTMNLGLTFVCELKIVTLEYRLEIVPAEHSQVATFEVTTLDDTH